MSLPTFPDGNGVRHLAAPQDAFLIESHVKDARPRVFVIKSACGHEYAVHGSTISDTVDPDCMTCLVREAR